MRDTDIVFKTLTGDTEAADRLMGIARTHVGILKQQMALGGLKVGSRTVAFPDGSSIRIVVAGGHTRMEIQVSPSARGQSFELPTVEHPQQPEYHFEPRYAVCVAAYSDTGGLALWVDAYDPMPVVINGVQYADKSGRILASGHASYYWPTVPNADLPVPTSFMTAIYDMNKGVQAPQYLISGGSILRNGQVIQPITRYIINTLEDLQNAFDKGSKVGGPALMFGNFRNLDLNHHGAVQVVVGNPPWDSGTQLLLECSADKNIQPLVVDISAGAKAFTTGGNSGGELSGTLTVNNLSVALPSGVNGLQGFIPFNDEVGYELNITQVAQAAPTREIGLRPISGFFIEIGFGEPNWPPIDLTKPYQFTPGWPAADAEVDFTWSAEILGAANVLQQGTSAVFGIAMQIQGEPTTGDDKYIYQWEGTTSGSLTGTIKIPDGWGGTRTIRLSAHVTMTVTLPPDPPKFP